MTQIFQIALSPEIDERLARLDERFARIESKLDRLAPEDRLWTTKDVAEYWGVTEETVRVKARTGELPIAQRAGNRMRFDPEEVRKMK